MSVNVDHNAFSAFEKTGWQQSADPYHQYFGALTSKAGAALLAAVISDDAGRNKSLLDLATGPGYLARQAAAGKLFQDVVGIDFSSAMVALASEEAKAAKLDIVFREGDAEQLSEPDHSFDAATMNFGMLHLARPQQAISEVYRVLKEGGRFGFTVWSEPGKCAGFSIILSAIEAFADKNSAQVPAGPPFFHFSDASNCIQALEAAGFKHATVREIDLLWPLQGSASLYDALLHGTVRTAGVLRAQPDRQLAKIRESVIQQAEKFRSGANVQIPMSVVLAVGTK